MSLSVAAYCCNCAIFALLPALLGSCGEASPTPSLPPAQPGAKRPIPAETQPKPGQAAVAKPQRDGSPSDSAQNGRAQNGDVRSTRRAKHDAEPGALAGNHSGAKLEPAWQALMRLSPRQSTSIGASIDGRLEGGVQLPERAPGLRANPRRRPEARYGTVEVIQALIAASAKFAGEKNAMTGVTGQKNASATSPGQPTDDRDAGEVWINDLSLRHGGPIAHHESHRSGLDVDVLFLLRDAQGNVREPIGAPLDPRGRGTDYGDLADPRDDLALRLDAERTWRWFAALLEQPHAPVHRIFIAEHLRSLLLKAGKRAGARPATLGAFAERTCQPAVPHDDHAHIRFFCSIEDMRAGCEDAFPIYPWRRRQILKAGLKPRIHRRSAKRPPSKTVSAKQARVNAGKLHPSVEAFLERRKQWSKKPHPGRRYCR